MRSEEDELRDFLARHPLIKANKRGGRMADHHIDNPECPYKYDSLLYFAWHHGYQDALANQMSFGWLGNLHD